MKTRIYFALLITLMLTSCMLKTEDKSAVNNNSIVGEWVEYDANDPTAEEYLTAHIIFRPDGRGQWKLMGDLYNPKAVRESMSFSWTQNGNTITASVDGEEIEYELHGNELLRAGALGLETYHKKR